MYPRYSESEVTQVLRKLAISHMGCGEYPVPLRCDFVGVTPVTPSSSRLAETRYSLATRAGDIFEMGSDPKTAAEKEKDVYVIGLSAS